MIIVKSIDYIIPTIYTLGEGRRYYAKGKFKKYKTASSEAYMYISFINEKEEFEKIEIKESFRVAGKEYVDFLKSKSNAKASVFAIRLGLFNDVFKEIKNSVKNGIITFDLFKEDLI